MSRFKNFLQTSFDATKRALAWNVENLMPPAEKLILNFGSKEELHKWHLYSDSQYGGLSSASLETKADGVVLRGVFSGNLSSDVAPEARLRINRSGFCGMRSKKFNGFIDLDSYNTIMLKVKGDGRSYISTIYTENWVNSPGREEDNSWQAFLFVPKGDWHIAKIPLDDYLPTWRGSIIDANVEMNPARVVGMSLSVNAEGGIPGTKTGPGDFQLEIDCIKAIRS